MDISGLATMVIGGGCAFVVTRFLVSNVITGTTTADNIFLVILPLGVAAGVAVGVMRGLMPRFGKRD